MNGMDLSGEIWVETKAGDNKVYFYNARTRETTWTKPEGENVKVLTQQQVKTILYCDFMLYTLLQNSTIMIISF